VHGIGKSTWATQAPGCILLNIEDGVADIDCAKTEHLRDLDQVNDALLWLFMQKHDFKTVAIDSADWLESLIHAQVAKKAGKESIADIGYGAGYKQALAIWDQVLSRLDRLRMEKGMGVILLAHCAVKKHQDPEQESYDRYQPALHDLASAMLQEWCDEVFFASYRVFLKKEDQGFGKTRALATGGTERYIRTQETAACLAKNRLVGLPAEIGFSWSEYEKFFGGVVPVSEVKKG
jgi:hypothetical protein